jgi:hypothetical protein
MDKYSTSSLLTRHIFAVLGFLLLITIGLVILRGNLYSFFLARPSINALILLLGVSGLAISFWELYRLYNQAKLLDEYSELISSHQELQIQGTGLVPNRIARLKLFSAKSPVNYEAVNTISDADMAAEDSRGAYVRYVLGVMIFLGLIGTFWGVLITVQGVQKVLDALDPSKVDDPIAFVTQLKSSMGGLLGGLSTAFSTSLFGLAGSVLLGFVDLQTQKARTLMLYELDRFVVSEFLPAYETPITPNRMSGKSDISTEQLYHIASQETLAENLRKLSDVFQQQSQTNDKITDAIFEMKGILESFGEEQTRLNELNQSAVIMRQTLLDKTEFLNKNFDKLIKEVRLSRESADSHGKAFLDQLKLEGEITNKTLSIGFSDITRNFKSIIDAGSNK